MLRGETVNMDAEVGSGRKTREEIYGCSERGLRLRHRLYWSAREILLNMKDMKLVGLRGEDAESYRIRWRRTIDCGHR